MSLTPGSQLGLYEIVAAIDAGGMGEVYKAREAQAVAALNHPGIVTIHSVEQADGQFFLTMEPVGGRSLAAATPPTGSSRERHPESGDTPSFRSRFAKACVMASLSNRSAF